MPSPLPDTYTIFAYDINTNTKLTELPGSSVTFDSRLNDPGSISFSCLLDSPGVQALVNPVLAYDGNPFKVYVDENGTIIWSGWCETTNFSKSTGAIDFGGKELLGWGDQRIIVNNYDDVRYPSGIDPAILIQTIVNEAQTAGTGSSIGLQIVASPSGITPVIPGYPKHQYTTINQIIADMVAISVPGFGGVDVSVNSHWDPTTGVPIDVLTVWPKRAGRRADLTGLIFDLDTVMDFTWPTDSTQQGNHITATGGGTGAAIPVETALAPGAPFGGLGQAPWLDKVANYHNVQSQDQIALMAAGAAQQFGKPLKTPTVIVPLAGQIGTWLVGDDTRIVSSKGQSPRFPNGLDQDWRIVQHTVALNDEGVYTVTLTLNIPPIV